MFYWSNALCYSVRNSNIPFYELCETSNTENL